MPRPPISRAALERVLARAAQLQASEADPSDAMLTDEQLLEVGQEVGLSPQHLRQALAEERSRAVVPEEHGRVARLFGPAIVHASRTLRGTPAAVFESLDAWMQREESLQVKRRFPDRMVWEPRAGFVTDIRRAFNIGGRGYHLSRAYEVAATAFAVDAERVLVRLEANLANVRAQRLATGSLTTGSGIVATTILLTLGFFAPVAAIPTAVGLVGGYVTARSHTPVVARAQIALEQVLDRLERGEMPRPSLFDAIGTPPRIR
ncbi:MAG TPA: hypothetical protein VFW98_15080 [Gemmatimonadaceae bacterium]|nr:hypothetical protein [Gemmatimonadaceae bacterium]